MGNIVSVTSSPVVPSGPSKLEQARMKLWEQPAPTTREQFLERKDLRNEVARLEKQEYMTVHKAGYGTVMSLRGKVSGENDNGM